MANRQEELTRLLRGLQLRQIAERYGELALRAAREGISHEGFLYELALEETAYRQQRRRERLLRDSRLPREKTFAQLELSRFSPLLLQQLERLRSGSWVREAVNVIAVGRPGAGKSHTTAALGHVLVEQGYAVYWTSTAALVQQLLAAKRDLRLPQELTRLDREPGLPDDINEGFADATRRLGA